VKAQEYRYQNIYQSGYYRLKKDSYEIDESVPFTEWDMGFDFYAPQTFQDASGRYILIGWMGIPDADYTNIPSVKDGWQHTLTLARELSVNEKGKVTQMPLKEYEALRDEEIAEKDGTYICETAQLICPSIGDKDVCITIDRSLNLRYDGKEKVMELFFDPEAESEDAANGCGRRIRKAKLDALSDLTVYLDRSALEVYVNGGETVFSTRFYTAGREHEIVLSPGVDARVFALKGFEIRM
nr:GH32 C-terminal domain-containing protein [Lachnospiraceae bacterium]